MKGRKGMDEEKREERVWITVTEEGRTGPLLTVHPLTFSKLLNNSWPGQYSQ